VNPGTFNINAMDKFTTRGVSFFFPLPGPNKPMETFDLMLDTAQFLAKKLGGEVKDDQRNSIRPQTLEHYRQRIRDFERRRAK
jgi:cell division protein ZipA